MLLIRTLSCFILLTIFSYVTLSAQIDNQRSSVIDKLRLEYDSVYALNGFSKNSPLVLAFKKVKHKDETYGYHGKLYNLSGELVLPFTVYYHTIYGSNDCKRSLLKVRTKDYWYGYDMNDSTREYDYIFDINTTRAIDSGWVWPLLGNRYLPISKRGQTNVYDLCDGYVFNPDDPVTYMINHVWESNGEIRFIVEEKPLRLGIINSKKQWIASPVFSWINWTTDWPLKRDPEGWIDYRFNDWLGKINPLSGKLKAQYLLDVESLRWWFCDNSDDKCIFKVRLENVENRNPMGHISIALVKIERRCPESS